MSRSADERAADIVNAIDRCSMYRPHLDSADLSTAAMAYDAVLRNLAVIGEAVRSLPEELTDTHPDIQWTSIAGLRNVIVHEYFRVRPDLIVDILDNELAPLRVVLQRAER